MASTLPPATPAPASLATPVAAAPSVDTSSSSAPTASASTAPSTAAPSRNRSQRAARNKDSKGTKDTKDSSNGIKKDTKESAKHNRRDKSVNKTGGHGHAAGVDPSSTSDTVSSFSTQPAMKQGPSKRRNSKSSVKNAASQPAQHLDAVSSATESLTGSTDQPLSNSTTTKKTEGAKRANASRQSSRKPKGSGSHAQSQSQNHDQTSSTDVVKESVEPTLENPAAATATPTSTPKRSSRLSISANVNNEGDAGSNNKHDRKKNTSLSTANNTNGQAKKKSHSNKKEPITAAAPSSASPDASTKGQGNKEGAVAAGAGKKSGRSQGSRQDSAKNKDKDRGKNSKDTGDKEQAATAEPLSLSLDVRPSSLTSSCSFETSSSSVSPTSPVSPISSSADQDTFHAGFTGVSSLPSPRDVRRDSGITKPSRQEKLASIRTGVARDGYSPFSAPLSAGTSASPSSRRSSTLTPLSANFGRLGGGLPTVEEGSFERQSGHHPMDSLTQGQPAKRGHTRSLSMKDQLAQHTHESGKEGTTLKSLQEIISSLKSLPPTTISTTADSSQNTIRHEKRLSVSNLSSRNSVGPLIAGGTSSTTLHISQPPHGTTIENALQSTVATLRRLSISDTRRPLVPLKEDEAEIPHTVQEKGNNRRSVAFSKATTPTVGDTYDSRRTSAASGYQPNRRSIIIKPEEVAALQEGRSYPPLAFSFSSDDEPDGVQDALSALEGKPSSNRSSYAAKEAHQRLSSSVDAGSLAEFAARLPNHMKGMGAAALVNNDDVHDRRRYTTAFPSGAIGANRASTLASAGAPSASKRLSTMSTTRESDRKDWRMSTPTAGHSNRESVSLKDGANGRRPLFTAHLTYSDFHSLLTKQKNKYVQGVLRINKRNRSDAYVTVDSLPEGDVYICGSKDRNRALEGDVVGLELIDPEELLQQKMEGSKDRRKSRRTEEAEDMGEAEVDEIKPKYCGRVVSIVERSQSQMFSGTLTLQRPSGSAKKSERKNEDDQKDQPRIVWFKPTDKRVPLIAIPIDQAPADFIENHSSYTHKLFVATIKRWPLSSLHPFGQLERELGDIGNIEIETEALLADNNVTTTAFGDKVEKCLPELPWVIPEKELSRRRDLRQHCIFTIDPATAKDLDDAVSCSRLDDGMLEIGVHIADVSHFIKVGSALDREAKSRATTVYLVQKAIPMLPNVLCEDLCSLTANVDRLAFSVFWKMTEDGEILDTTFAKSVIRSCAQLSYDDAQRVITTGSLDPNVDVMGQPRTLVEDNIKTFFKLSQIFRQKRFENGALAVNSIKLSFDTDEIHNPLDVSVYELKESNRLIEEFMLLANMSVAKQICEYFPDQALLRRHEEPLEKRMVDFILHMNKIGLDLDASSSGALQRSLDAIQDPDVRKVVRLLVIKPMQRAKYICSGMLTPDKYHHYALNAPLYTHFTSPIRRYADIIVHRMLEASLAGDSKFYMSKELCQKSANHCNIKKDAAKLAQEQSSNVYLSVLLRNMTESKGMVIRDAVVVQVLDAAFDVLVPEYGLEKRIYVDQLPLERHTWNGSTETLKLHWTMDAFKQQVNEDSFNESEVGDKSRRLSTLPPAHGHAHDAMDHPDVATNAYDDERGLFDDDESDYEDEGPGARAQPNGAHAEEEDAEEEGDDEARRVSRIRIFGHVNVLITADTTVSPPIIKVVAVNPYATESSVLTV